MKTPFCLTLAATVGLIIGMSLPPTHASAPAVTAIPSGDFLDTVDAIRGNPTDNARHVNQLVNSMGDINSSVYFGGELRVPALEVNGTAYFQYGPTIVDEMPASPSAADMEANLRQIRASLVASGLAH